MTRSLIHLHSPFVFASTPVCPVPLMAACIIYRPYYPCNKYDMMYACTYGTLRLLLSRVLCVKGNGGKICILFILTLAR